MVGKRFELDPDGYDDGMRDREKTVASAGVPVRQKNDLLTATEAIEYLDVKRPTLYTYVSRGWVRSLPSASGRGRLYVREDLERLKSRSHAHVGHASTSALPSETQVTRIDAGGPIYRGHSAATLARAGVPFESVAELLWTGELTEKCPDWSKRPISSDHLRDLEVAAELAKRAVVHVGAQELQPLVAIRLGVTVLSARRRARMPSAQRNEMREARELLLLSAELPRICGDASLVTPPMTVRGIAARLANAWESPAVRVEPARRVRAIDQALVLSADHGLDALAIAVRMMAAAGGDLYACVSSGLDAMAGFEYESICMQLEHIVCDLVSPSAVRRYVAANMERGHSIPGFGHPWYPAGDPRVPLLLEQAAALAQDERRVRNVMELIEAARDQGAPTLEVGMVALAAALDLPFGSTSMLVALGRMAGFIAHVFEQWDSAGDGELTSQERVDVSHRRRRGL